MQKSNAKGMIIILEITINKLSKLAGISTRTLRYYDEIGILRPTKTSSAGYRIYGQNEIDRLQQILFYRELDVKLEDIQQYIDARTFDPLAALEEHRKTLLAKKERIEELISNIDKTIAMKKGGRQMSDQEKFEGFKKKMIEENEVRYGKEIREKYGEDEISYSYNKMKKMTPDEYKELEKLSLEVNEAIKAAFATNDPAGELAQKACELHKKWIQFFWKNYSEEAHMNLVQMYVDDARFTEYYDKIAPGSAVFLRDSMKIFTSEDKES